MLSDLERRKVIRSLELEAYASVVTAFRAQGPLTENKKSALELLCKHFSISPGRHRAEIRRATCDDRLSSIAERSPLTDWERQWRKEGQRLAPSNAKFTSRPTTHLPQALTVATLATKLNKSKPESDPNETSAVKPSNEKKTPSQRVQNVLKYIIAQNPNGTLAKAQQMSSSPVKQPQKVQSAPTTPVKKPLTEKKVASSVTKTMSPLKALVLGRASVGQTRVESKKSVVREKTTAEGGLECTESLDSSPDKGRPTHETGMAKPSAEVIKQSNDSPKKRSPAPHGSKTSIKEGSLPGSSKDKPQESVPTEGVTDAGTESVVSTLRKQTSRNAIIKVIPYKVTTAPEPKQEADDKKIEVDQDDKKIEEKSDPKLIEAKSSQHDETSKETLETEQQDVPSTHETIPTEVHIDISEDSKQSDESEFTEIDKKTEDQRPLLPATTLAEEDVQTPDKHEGQESETVHSKDEETTSVTSSAVDDLSTKPSRKRPASTDVPSPVKRPTLSNDSPKAEDPSLPLSTSKTVDTAKLEEKAPNKAPPTVLSIEAPSSIDTVPAQESSSDPLPIAPETPVVDTDKLLQTLSTDSFNREEAELASELGVDPSLLDLSFILPPETMSLPGTPTTPLMVHTPTTPLQLNPTAASPIVLDPPPLLGLSSTEPPSLSPAASVPPGFAAVSEPVASVSEQPQPAVPPLIIPSAPIMTPAVSSDLSKRVDISSPILPPLSVPVTINPSELYETITSPEDGTFLNFDTFDNQENQPMEPAEAKNKSAPTRGEPVLGEPSKEVVQLTSKDLDILREMGLSDEGVQGIVGGVNEDALLEGIPQDLAATIQAIAGRDSLPWNQ